MACRLWKMSKSRHALEPSVSNTELSVDLFTYLYTVTLIAAAFILTFTSIEFFDYRRVTTDTSLVVDKSRGERLTVKMNVTFPRVPCYRQLYS